jgi:hypothetical protein
MLDYLRSGAIQALDKIINNAVPADTACMQASLLAQSPE